MALSLLLDGTLSFGTNLLSAIVYDFAKNIPEARLKYFPNALLFSKEALVELEQKIDKFLTTKRFQHRSHPVLHAYFKSEDSSDIDRLRPLVLSALFDESYSTEACTAALTDVRDAEINKAEAAVKSRKKNVSAVDYTSYELTNIDIEDFNDQNIATLKKALFEKDEISKLLVTRLRAAPLAFDDEPAVSLTSPDDEHDSKNSKHLHEYCQEIHSVVSTFMTSGIDAFLRQEQVDSQLEASFVSLSLRNIYSPDLETDSESAEHVFNNFRYVIARGDAGSGKTTLLQWISLQCVKAHLNKDDEAGIWNNIVPIFVPLRRVVTGFNGKINVSDFAYLSTGSLDFARRVDLDWMEWLLNGRQTLIMFDGVDEIPFKERRAFWIFVEQFTRKYPKPRIIVTSRNLSYTHTADGNYKNVLTMSIRDFSAHRWEWSPPDGFIDFQIAPLSDDDVTLFIEKWHKGLSKDVLHPETISQLSAYPLELTKVLADPIHVDIKAICRIPLLCALVCIVNLFSHGRLPNSLRKLYYQSVRILSQTRDEVRNVPAAAEYRVLDAVSRVDMLGHIALKMQEGTGKRGMALESEKRDVLAWIDEYRKQREDEQLNKMDVGNILTFYTERTNLLREPTLGKIDFIHRSFLEYLAANEFVKRRPLASIKDRLFDDTWTGVLRFMMDTEEGGAFFAGAIVDSLLSVTTGKESRARLALQRLSVLMAHSNRLPDDKYKYLNKLIRDIWPPNSDEDAIALLNLPYEAFGGLVKYTSIRDATPERRKAATYLICHHSDPRMRSHLSSGYFDDNSLGVAKILNSLRLVGLKDHTGLWDLLRRNDQMDIYCDDVRELVEKWHGVEFRMNLGSIGHRAIVDDKTKHISELARIKTLSAVIVEGDAELLNSVRRILRGSNIAVLESKPKDVMAL